MLEALWSVEFVSNVQGYGAGVAVFETGRILGGDASFYYVGNYKVENGTLIAEIKVVNYRGEPNSIFGPLKEFTLHVSGKPQSPEFEVAGNMAERPELHILIRLTRRAELP